MSTDRPAPAPDRAADRPLRALVVSQPTDGGVATCVRQLVCAANARGHRVVLACPDDGGGLADWAAGAGITHVPLFDRRRLPSPRDLPDVLVLRRLAAGADVVHLHSSKAGLLGRVAVRSLPPRRRPGVVFTPHAWSWSIGGRAAAVLRRLERWLAPWADVTIAVSRGEAAAGAPVVGDRARVEVVPNGVDRQRFAPDGPSAERAGDGPLLVCVGRLTRQKGQDVAVTALARPALAGARLRLVGDGPDRAALEALAGRLGVADRVELTGQVDDVVPHYRAADVVVAPSRWEGLSLAWLEALACGCAMIVTDVAGAEAVRDAAVVIDDPDPGALAREAAALLDDPTTRQALGRAARDRSADHDLERSLAATLTLWERVAGAP